MILWYVLTVIIVLLILLNQKINIFIVLKQYIKSLHKFNQVRISWFDILTFLIAPMGLCIIIVYVFNFSIDKTMVSSLITTFALIATMLFTFLSITIAQYQSNESNLRIDVANETTGTIILTILLAIVNCTLLFISVNNMDLISTSFNLVIIVYLSLQIFLNMLIVLKRISALIISR